MTKKQPRGTNNSGLDWCDEDLFGGFGCFDFFNLVVAYRDSKKGGEEANPTFAQKVYEVIRCQP